MGVAWVFEVNQTVKSVERLLETHGAELAGPFSVDVTPYIPATQHRIDIPLNYVIHHSNFPQTTFSITPSANGKFKQSPKAVCDRGFDMILSKMRNGTMPDTMGKIEIIGNEYSLTDFAIRVGTATQVTTVKGNVVEVEFKPSFVVTQCKDILTEFMDFVFDKYTSEVPEVFTLSDKPDYYTALDTMWQYVTIVSKLRKKT